MLGTPPLPVEMPLRERRAAHWGHAAIYALVVLIALTGLAIADFQGFGNAYFGIKLPPIYPAVTEVVGWSVDPWSYVVHATLAYSLLLLVSIHVAAVFLHRKQGLGLETRMAGRTANARLWIDIAAAVFVLTASTVIVGALRGHLTIGPAEVPRDYTISRGT